MSNPLPLRIQQLYIIRNTKKSYNNNNNKKKNSSYTLVAVQTLSLQDEELWSKACFQMWLLEPLLHIKLFGVWQRITRGEQKDSMMNLHYSHSLGHFQSLKVRQCKSWHTPRVLPNQNPGFESNYSYWNSSIVVAFAARRVFSSFFLVCKFETKNAGDNQKQKRF